MPIRRNKLAQIALLATTLVGCGATVIPAAATQGQDSQMETSSTRPILLTVTGEGDFLDVAVTAGKQCDCSGRFSLAASAGNSNRSVNSASFGSGISEGAVLTRVRVNAAKEWDVELVVEVDGRDAYTEHRSSSGSR